MARFRLFALPLLLVGALPAPLAKALEMHADVNRRDGLVDRVLAVEDADGPALLVFEDPGEQGMLEPERVPLPAPATSLAAGRFDEDVFVDILAICGDALVVVHGRDRMLTLSDRDVAAPVLSVIPLDEEVDASLAKRKISFAEIPASGFVFVVDSTADSPDAAPGDGACLSSGGGCTLRAAIGEANAFAGTDTIAFSLGAGVPAISPASPLPAITEAVTIDGATGGATRVEIEGSSAGAGAHGLRLASSVDGAALRNLVLNRFAGDGIRIEGANSTVTGCFVGTDASGSALGYGNSVGIRITEAGATGNTIGGLTVTPGTPPGNVISGNTALYEVEIEASASGNLVQGNVVGLDASGTAVVGGGRIRLIGTFTPATQNNTIGGSVVSARNVLRGLTSYGFASITSNRIQGNFVGTDLTGTVALGGACLRTEEGGKATFGGNAPVAGDPPGNVVSGCDDAGVLSVGDWMNLDRSGATVLGNAIGLAADGMTPLPNDECGVLVLMDGRATVGGPSIGDGNVISGNAGPGIDARDSATIRGNRIGLDRSGTAIVPNQGPGIAASSTSSAVGVVTIGGENPGDGNTIAGNAGHGIAIAGQNSLSVLGNRIGVLLDGVTAAGNGGHGVSLESSSLADIGGTTGVLAGTCVGSCNLIANNLGAGIRSNAFNRVTIGGNSVRDNGELGIDRAGAGVTPNVPGAWENFPLVTSVAPQGADTKIHGSLNAGAAQSYRIEVFWSAAADPTGYGEGAVYGGATSCTTNASGNCSWAVLAPGIHPIWTATATRSGGSTSEFSQFYDPNGDGDGDGIVNSADNCPSVANPLQEDGDGDRAGNACDNCPPLFNAGQGDTDADGLGDLCDNCPDAANASQADFDADGRGDACDCQALDASDRAPSETLDLRVDRVTAAARLSWSVTTAADAYSVTRGDLSTLAPGAYGGCAAEGVAGTSWDDEADPSPGSGFAYLVQAQNDDCGTGTLGRDSEERERVNGSGSACSGRAHTDAHPSAETAVSGSVSGTFTATQASDGTYESITEVESSGGNPSTRYSRLEHRWTIAIPAGSSARFHVEGFRSSSTDGDDFTFAYSTDGVSFVTIPLPSLTFSDANSDLDGPLPGGLVGNVTFRVADTNRTPGNRVLDTVTLDEIFVRVVP